MRPRPPAPLECARTFGRLALARARLPWALRRAGLDAVLAQLTPAPPPAPRAGTGRALRVAIRGAEALVRLVPLLPATCLYRALGRYSALRHAGVPATFVMGVRLEGPEPEGHAWIELDGRPWLEPAPAFTETFRYPRSP